MLKIWDTLNGEKIIIVIKKHFIINIIVFVVLFFSSLITITLIYFYINNFSFSLWLIIFWQLLFLIIYTYLISKEVEITIITDTKIIFVHKISFLKKEYVEFHLKEIKEIKAISEWLLWNIFHYWEIQISTKDNKLFHLTFIPNPIDTAHSILSIQKI